MTTTPLLVSVPEAARLASVDRVTAYRAIKAGEWPSVRVRSRIRVPRIFLEQLAANAMEVSR